MASLLAQVQAGGFGTPVERALARWDGVITEEAMRRVNELRLTDRGGDRSNGEGRFRGSLLGGCPRHQIASFRGYIGDDPDEVGADIMKDGTYRHYLWQEVGLSAGFLTEVEAKTWYEPYHFGGQLDGLMAPDEFLPGRGGFELKTTNTTKYREVVANGRPFEKHLAQIGGYCRSLDLDWFSVVYEVRSYTVERHEYVVMNDAYLQTMTAVLFQELLGYEDREELPPIKAGYPNDNECRYMCSLTRICPSMTY